MKAASHNREAAVIKAAVIGPSWDAAAPTVRDSIRSSVLMVRQPYHYRRNSVKQIHFSVWGSNKPIPYLRKCGSPHWGTFMLRKTKFLDFLRVVPPDGCVVGCSWSYHCTKIPTPCSRPNKRSSPLWICGIVAGP